MKLLKEIATRLRERSQAERLLRRLSREPLYGVLLTATRREQEEMMKFLGVLRDREAVVPISRDDACVCGDPRSAHIHEIGPCRPGFRCEADCTGFTLARASRVLVEREAVDSTRVDAVKEIVQEWGHGRMTDEYAMQRVAEKVDE